MRFEMDSDARKAPLRKLNDGTLMPSLGLGTFGSDHVNAAQVAEAVRGALRAGYRFIDCAACYGNEAEIGAALEEALKGGLAREELFVLSKAWNDCHSPKALTAACEKSLKDLRLDYLDAYLIHWPFPNHHAPGCDVTARNPAARPYIHEEYMETWRAMERLRERGLVRSIGASNLTIPKMRLLLRDASVPPAIHEMELHPSFQQGELFQYCLDSGVQPVGYCPVGSPARPERDRTYEDVDDLQLPEVKEIAEAHGVHPAIVCLKWSHQRGAVPIPFSVTRNHYLANLKCVLDDPLTPEEFDKLRGAERNCRLVKGQVFLWPGAKTWLDLWDADGTIPGWDGYQRS